MLPDTADLDAGETLALLEATVARRRQAEVDDLLLVQHYADLNSAIPADCSPGGETLGDLGGDGTPGVRELAIVELGIARQVHTHSARAVTADALDLRHRLPHTWDLVKNLQGEVWVARKVASMSRKLSYEAVTLVDRAVADAITGESPGRVLDLARAKIIEADRPAHDARVAAELTKRYVARSRTDDEGLCTMIARIRAGEATELDDTVQRIADLLAAREAYTDLDADELRAEAFAWLARPEDIIALLEGAEEPRQHRTHVVLYVHLSEAALTGAQGIEGIARVEGLGPHTLTQLTALLGHAHITLKPVIDLAENTRVNAYEFPEAMKERIHLRWTGDAFPHATSTTRNVDIDHPVSYDKSGPPGQTTSHTGQPLSRTPHRAKTHLGYTCTPTTTGEILWRTPHGLHRVVDATGTHRIDQSEYDAWTIGDDLDRALVRLTHRIRIGTI